LQVQTVERKEEVEMKKEKGREELIGFGYLM
jgi:hypothetical protein